MLFNLISVANNLFIPNFLDRLVSFRIEKNIYVLIYLNEYFFKITWRCIGVLREFPILATLSL